LDRDFYRRSPLDVAPDLLGKVLVAGSRAGRIVEVEAYLGGVDPAAHTYRGRTARNEVMYGRPGLLYVYFTYGMHWCANAVCGDEDEGVAVLLRALEPVDGVEEMRVARPAARTDRDLCRGPARLCQALGITGHHNGLDLVRSEQGVTIADDGTPPPADPVQTTRVGISVGVDSPWRWYVQGSRFVSKP
jgi:DNA-3-methyladenine glycosylase